MVFFHFLYFLLLVWVSPKNWRHQRWIPAIKESESLFLILVWVDWLFDWRSGVHWVHCNGIWLPLPASNYFSLFSGFFGLSMQFGPSRQFDSTYRWSSPTKSPPSGHLGTLSYAPIKRKNTHNNKNKASHIKLDASN